MITQELSDDDFMELYMGLGGDETKKPKPESKKAWAPSLSPKQQLIFNDTTTPMLLLVSSRFTGKSYATAHVAIRSAYDEWGAVVLIVAKTKNQLALGLFDTIANEILPEYVENLDGFSFEGPKQSISKDTIFIITNRFGGKSLIQLMSVANSADAKRKIRGLTASMVLVEEITIYEDGDFLEELTGILGRRPNIPPERQRLLATCNPTDPESWVCDRWKVLNPELRPAGYKVVQFFKEDNPTDRVKAYYERLSRDLAHNPTKLARDVFGQWVAVPSGEALFADYFTPERHVIGDAAAKTGLQPMKNLPILIGLDLGDTNHGVSIMQVVPTKDKNLWLVFDEFESVGKRVSLEEVTRKIMVKINGWGQTLDFDFSVTAISDNSAFNRYRAGTGSLDHAEIEKHWKAMMPQFPRIKFQLRILEAPKGDGSVVVRTRLIQDLFTRDEMYVSATCKAHVLMLTKISGTKKTPQAPDTHDVMKHIFDALSYVVVHQKTSEIPEEETEETIKPEIIRMGSRSLR